MLDLPEAEPVDGIGFLEKIAHAQTQQPVHWTHVIERGHVAALRGAVDCSRDAFQFLPPGGAVPAFDERTTRDAAIVLAGSFFFFFHGLRRGRWRILLPRLRDEGDDHAVGDDAEHGHGHASAHGPVQELHFPDPRRVEQPRDAVHQKAQGGRGFELAATDLRCERGPQHGAVAADQTGDVGEEQEFGFGGVRRRVPDPVFVRGEIAHAFERPVAAVQHEFLAEGDGTAEVVPRTLARLQQLHQLLAGRHVHSGVLARKMRAVVETADDLVPGFQQRKRAVRFERHICFVGLVDLRSHPVAEKRAAAAAEKNGEQECGEKERC